MVLVSRLEQENVIRDVQAFQLQRRKFVMKSTVQFIAIGRTGPVVRVKETALNYFNDSSEG